METHEHTKEHLVSGIYFKSKNDVSSYYLIELDEGSLEGKALVRIYTMYMPERYLNMDEIINGSAITVPDFEVEYVAEIDLCYKYFFPKFNNEMQLYYDHEKYYAGNCKTDSITSLFEAINYGIEYGLNKSGTTPI